MYHRPRILLRSSFLVSFSAFPLAQSSLCVRNTDTGSFESMRRKWKHHQQQAADCSSTGPPHFMSRKIACMCFHWLCHVRVGFNLLLLFSMLMLQRESEPPLCCAAELHDACCCCSVVALLLAAAVRPFHSFRRILLKQFCRLVHAPSHNLVFCAFALSLNKLRSAHDPVSLMSRRPSLSDIFPGHGLTHA